MNTPPSRLFTQLNTISAGRPGTLRRIRSVPRRSTPSATPPVRTTTGSGTRIRDRCSSEAASTTIPSSRTARIPSNATSSPDNTEVTRKDTPVADPTRPFARSRTSAGTSSVTSVGIATVRRFPVITPSISSTTKPHSSGLPGSRNSASGVDSRIARQAR